MTIKSQITKEVNILEKYGWIVFNFQSHRKQANRGYIGWVDYVLIHKGIIFIEVKIGKDKENPKQTKLKEMLLAGGQIRYYTMTEKNYMDIIKEILEG